MVKMLEPNSFNLNLNLLTLQEAATITKLVLGFEIVVDSNAPSSMPYEDTARMLYQYMKKLYGVVASG